MRALVIAPEPKRATAIVAALGARRHDAEVAAPPGDEVRPHALSRFDLVWVDVGTCGPLAVEICQRLSGVGDGPFVAVAGIPDSPAQLEALLAAGAHACVPGEPRNLEVQLVGIERAVDERARFARVTFELRASEERYRSVIGAIEEGVMVLDSAGTLVAYNASAERLLGTKSSEVGEYLRRTENVFVREDGTALTIEELPAYVTLRTGRTVKNAVVGIRHANRQTTWLLVNSQAVYELERSAPYAAVCSLTDITEQRRYETNLRALIEGAPDAVIVHRDGRVVYVNPKTASLLGYDAPRDLVGVPIMDLIHPDFRQIVRERVGRNVEHGEMSPSLEQVLLRRDGSEVEVEINGLAVEFDGKLSVLAHARDITARRQLEGQLIMAERLASIGRLAAAVGHEINNPLAYIIGNLEAALRMLRNRPDEQPRDLLEPLAEALDGAERVRHIVRDLKVFSRDEAEERAHVDVRVVLETCLRMAENELRYRARVIRRFGSVPPVVGNEARLAQVFLNLLVNAAQSVPDGAVERNHVAIETSTLPDGRVGVVISDTGGGIHPEHLARIFEPFFTTKPGGRGTGLGLSICHTLVTAYGGEIDVTSKVGQGTSVRVVLPAARDTHPQPSITKASPPMSRKRILIVDDEPLVARTLERSLPEHDVTVAANGREAIERLENSPEFDLVLCDLMMPGFSGMDLYEHVRRTMPGTDRRFVFMTGGAFTPRAEEFLSSVNQPYLEKPFQLDELLATVRKVLGPPSS